MTNTISNARIVDFRVRVPPEHYANVDVPEENSGQYDAVLGTAAKFSAVNSVDDLISLMDEAGIDHAVMHAEHETGDLADELNRAVADTVEKHPSRFTGIGAISLENFSIKRALKQLEDCVDFGFIGVCMEPAFFGMALNDKIFYPVYAKAMEKNLLVAVHAGINYTSNRPMSGENPILLDEIACNFPDLTIVASHGGWPWIAEMVGVARKHPNVFIEFGGLAPKYVGARGSGWEVMYRFMNSVLSGQVLFGTDWPTMDHTRVVREWKELGLKPSVLDALLAGNTKKLLAKHSVRP